jgi:hypothetical protein
MPRQKGGSKLMQMSRLIPSRGEQNITYNPELAALAEGKEVFEAGYTDPYARQMGYQARMPVVEPEPSSLSQELTPYLNQLQQMEMGLSSAEQKMGNEIEKQNKRAAKDDAEWTDLLDKRRKLEEELEKPKAPVAPVTPMPKVEKEPLVVPKQETKTEKQFGIELPPEQEKEFQEWWNNDHNVQQWLYEFEREYGEKPDPDHSPDYDYRKAWLGGPNEHPISVQEDDGRWRHHWGSAGKSEDHPTYHKQFEEGGSDKKVWSVDYQEDLGSYIQTLLNAQVPLPRHLYIKDIDQEVDLLGRVKDEEGNLLAERWFADDELLRSDVYQKEFENAIAPVTKEEEEQSKETDDGDRIQKLLKEFQNTQRELEEKLKEAKGKK